MPGIVVFRRRWSVGSDDMVVPALLLVVLHAIWLAALVVIFIKVEFDVNRKCSEELKDIVLGYIIILLVCLIVESVIMFISIRGGILDIQPRASMQYLLYLRIVVFLAELAWLVVGIRWLVLHYMNCDPSQAMKAVLGISVFNSCMVLILFICLWCTFDYAGRKWVKFKRYQESLKESQRRSRRSGSARRNWRQRKAMRAYEESWDRRLGLMCCCVERKGRNKNSMSEIAQLFTEFFRDLDVVPSDVVAGLVLLRRFQKLHMTNTIQQDVNDVYSYLSGVAVTPHTQFLQLGQPEVLHHYKLVIHYMRFAMAAYGWPIFMMMNTGTGLCRMLPYLRCCCCQACCTKGANSDYVLNDNCCQCNVVALKKLCDLPDVDLIYVTYHVDIGETPFFVALDNKYKKIVICVRGTLSLQDVLTDLKADAETLPLDPIQEDWVGHKGMVQAAKYIRQKLKDDMILTKAFEKCKERTLEKYDLVLVGHSLGAGTAAILAIMLQQEYQDIQCYAYSPPGGLLSYECMVATKAYITSVVVGKDIVPRIGLHQMELLRTDLINVIKKSRNPKWTIIMKGLCCGTDSASQMTYEEITANVERDVTAHPSDEQIGLTAHKPMYPPGQIILIVRNHHGGTKTCGTREPVYQAIWADNSDFQEVLVSPTMVNDHMPDNVMEALEKVLVNVAPPKPTRCLTEPERNALLKHETSPDTLNFPIHKKYQTADSSGDFFSNSDNPNILLEPMANSIVNPKSMINTNSKDVATDEVLLSLDQHHLFPALNKHSQSDVDASLEWTNAPLASPEVLSASSSASALSRAESLLKGEHKSEGSCSKMETIKQSPEMKVKTDSVIDFLEYECKIITDVDAPNENSASANNLCGGISYSTSAIFQRPFLLKPMSNVCIADAVKGSLNNLVPSSYFINELNNDNEQHTDISHAVSSPSLHISQHILDRHNIEQESTHTTDALYVPTCSVTAVQGDNPSTSHKEYMEEKCNNHLPNENIQYGYRNDNETDASASVGYQAEHSVGYSKPITMVPSDSNFTASTKRDKCLHYSQSESQLKGLSNEYTMKRSTEEGDIAHLWDSSMVFVGDNKKGFKPREREPVLRIGETQCDSEKLCVLLENVCLNFDELNVSENLDNNMEAGSVEDSKLLQQHNLESKNNYSDNSKFDIEPDKDKDNIVDTQRRETSVDKICASAKNDNHRAGINSNNVHSIDSTDDGNFRIPFNNSHYSNCASSTNGESDQ